MPPTTPRTTTRRAKRSFTLSPESVEFLESVRRKRRLTSVSAVLDDILLAARRDQEKRAMNQAISDYYSSLTASEKAEKDEWAGFATHQFTHRDT